MLTLIAMAVGILVGIYLFPTQYRKINNAVQVCCTAVLIFSMGVALGSRPNFFDEILTLGIDSLVLAVLPIIGSVLVVYWLSRKFLATKEAEKDRVQHDRDCNC